MCVAKSTSSLLIGQKSATPCGQKLRNTSKKRNAHLSPALVITIFGRLSSGKGRFKFIIADRVFLSRIPGLLLPHRCVRADVLASPFLFRFVSVAPWVVSGEARIFPVWHVVLRAKTLVIASEHPN